MSRRAADVMRARFDAAHHHVLFSETNLATILASRGKYAEARAARQREAFPMKKRLILILGLSAIPLVGGICWLVWINRPIEPGVTAVLTLASFP